MNQNVKKNAALVFLCLLMIVPAIIYDSLLTKFGALIVIWLCVVGFALNAKWSYETRGFLLLVGSLLVAVVCRTQFKGCALEELFAEFILVLGTGVGGNFIAAGLISRNLAAQKNNR